MQFTHWQTVSLGGLRWGLSFLTASLSMVLVGTVSGCNRQPAASPDKAAAPETPEVKVVRPQKKDVRRPIERPSFNIEAYERTLVYAKIPGYVQTWKFDMGDRVHRGDILAELFVPE